MERKIEAVRAGFWSAYRTRLYEMPVRLYCLTWLPNLGLQVLFYSLLALFAGGTGLAWFALVGNVVRLAALPTCVQTTSHLVADREEGTLAYLITTPVALAALLLGRSLYFSLEAFVTVLIVSAVFLPFAGVALTLPDLMLALAGLAVTCMSLSGLGLLVGSMVFRTRYDMVFTSLVAQSLTIVCGVMIPLSEFPLWAQNLARALPLTNGLAALRTILSADTARGAGLVSAELAIGAVYWAIGFMVLAGSVNVGRARGSLERF